MGTASGPPSTMSADLAKRRTAPATSSRCSVDTSGPIRVAGSRGSPTTTADSLADNASRTGSTKSTGTMQRRMHVHFCPALPVSSRTTVLTYCSNSSVPGTPSGPRIAAFTESASMFSKVERSVAAADDRMIVAVFAEPVNAK